MRNEHVDNLNQNCLLATTNKKTLILRFIKGPIYQILIVGGTPFTGVPVSRLLKQT